MKILLYLIFAVIFSSCTYVYEDEIATYVHPEFNEIKYSRFVNSLEANEDYTKFDVRENGVSYSPKDWRVYGPSFISITKEQERVRFFVTTIGPYTERPKTHYKLKEDFTQIIKKSGLKVR